MVAFGWQGGVTVGVMGVGLLAMGVDAVPPDFTFWGMIAALLAAGVIDVAQAGAGFANASSLSILALYAVSAGVEQTGALDSVVARVLGRTRSAPFALARMVLPVAAASGFLSNLAVVSLLVPTLKGWARRHGVAVKQLLVPLSFATVLGGTCTTMGTSTNLLIAGLMQARYGGALSFGLFALTPIGVPYALWGCAYLVAFSHWLLPRTDAPAGRHDDAGMVSALAVPPGAARAVGSLLPRSGVALAAIGRGDRVLPPPPSADAADGVRDGDVLYVSGPLAAARQLAAEAGLAPVDDASEADALDALGVGVLPVLPVDSRPPSPASCAASVAGDAPPPPPPPGLLRVRVRADAPLAGVAVRDAGLRTRFGATVVAVQRGGGGGGAAPAPAAVRLGDAVLTAGDAVILSIPPAFDAAADPSFAATFTDAAPVDAADARPFTTSLTVRRGARAVGRTPAAAGLTGVPGVVLFAVGRGGEMLTPPPPDLVLQAKDTLWFAGDAASVPFLRRVPGLAHSADGQAAKLPTHPVHRRLVQACVSAHSPLAGRTLRDVRFRDQYGAAVVAVHRAGAAPPAADVASIPLRAGDVLVLEAGPAFAAAAASRRAFSIISDLPHSAPPRRGARWVAAGIVLAMISAQVATAAVGGAVEERADLFLLASLAAAAMLATRCLSFANARASIEWDVYVTVAFAFGLATALEKSGVGAAVAAGFEAALHHGGVVASPTAVLTLIYFATCVLSEVVSNDAAAALMFPVAASLAEAFAIPPRRAAVALALGGSAGWVLPFSYQCNLIVLAAGNYTTREFATAGAPMYAWMTPFVAFAFHFADAWWIPLAVSAAAFALSPGVPLAAGAIGRIVAAAREGRAKRREGKEAGRRG